MKKDSYSLTAELWGQNSIVSVGGWYLLLCEWQFQWLIYANHLPFRCCGLYQQVLSTGVSHIYLACGSKLAQLPYITANLSCVWLAKLPFPEALCPKSSVLSSRLPSPLMLLGEGIEISVPNSWWNQKFTKTTLRIKKLILEDNLMCPIINSHYPLNYNSLNLFGD